MTDQSVLRQSLSKDKLILVGVISSVHGIKGNVVIRSFTDPARNIENLPIIDQNYQKIRFKILKTKIDGSLICSIDKIEDRTAAEQLVKKSLYCFRSELPEIVTEDEFYIEDLKDLEVRDNKGNHLGKIINVANYGAGDIIEVQFTHEKTSVMLPFTKEYFPEITDKYVVCNI